MKFTEKVLFIFALLAVCSKTFDPTASLLFLVAASLGLALLYLLLGFLLFNGLPLRAIFKKVRYSTVTVTDLVIAAIAGVVQSAMIIGLIFRIQHWSGGLLMIGSGLFISLLLALSSYLLKTKHATALFRNIMLRSLLITITQAVIVWSVAVHL